MKKIYLLTIFAICISFSYGRAENLLKSENKLPAWKCFDWTFYSTCGLVWQGDVCVYTELTFLTDQQIIVAWNTKNYTLCGTYPGY
jgi:hypothetical protein